MSDSQKQQNRIMGDYSIAKSFKGILRIGHILDLIKNENDTFFNPTYYGKPSKLINISGGAYESQQIGWDTPSKGMDGTIERYSNNNAAIKDDDLKIQRVPMTDSMGNYLNWNIGFEGITIGSDENINSNSIEIERFLQANNLGTKVKSDEFIWQEKYFPVLESGEILIGLGNKEYPSDKYKTNKESGLIIENKKSVGKLIIENQYDKTNPVKKSSGLKTFIQFTPDSNKSFRTIYQDDKNVVEDYDVFMYRQDNYDTDNYNYSNENITPTDFNVKGNNNVLNKFQQSNNNTNIYVPKKKQIDCNVGIVNLKDYVHEMIQKYLGSSLVEVPTGTIINQYCSLKKWYAYPDAGTIDDLTENSYPGHRPAMMSKRDVGMLPNSEDEKDVNNAFVQSTILGACKKINKLINPSYNFTNHENNFNQAGGGGEGKVEDANDLSYAKEGFYKEIIPLYKRDYVLCDGSIYAIWVFPKNFSTNAYPNRREAMDRFLDLFFSIGYQYTINHEYVNKRFKFEWFDTNNPEQVSAYKIVRANKKNNDNTANGEHLVTSQNCHLFLNEDGSPGEGYPAIDEHPNYLYTDRHALFVEDFLTILAFEQIYELYSKAGNAGIEWTTTGVNNWFEKAEIPEKYRLTSFIGDNNTQIKQNIANGVWIDRMKTIDNPDYISSSATPNETPKTTVSTLCDEGRFVMELKYYNFKDEGTSATSNASLNGLPIILLGREVKTFGDPIKFWDKTKGKWAIVPAYKLPQIQYFIDIFTHSPTPDTLASMLNTFYQYDFQVPNLCGNLPTFIGSSGVQWSDNSMRKVRKIESWTSDYAQYNYMHRHFIFVESSNLNPELGRVIYNGPFYNGEHSNLHGMWKSTGPDHFFKATNQVTENSFTAGAALWDGKISAECSGEYIPTFQFGQGEHPNYIWNELGAGSAKQSNITLINDPTNSNGMRFPIFQISSGGLAWTTGDYRKTRAGHGTDLIYKSSYKKTPIEETTWDSETIEFNTSIKNEKLQHESDSGWYGWEHYEDPRFDSAEPNRGRTSTPINQTPIRDCISYIRYDQNKNSFNITMDESIKEAEWFSPENIKMLPLIKL